MKLKFPVTFNRVVPYFTISVICLVFSARCLAESSDVVNGVTVFNDVPSAYELARVMFPPQTRSAVGYLEPDEVKPAGIVAFKINFYYDSVEILGESRPFLDAMGKMLKFAKLKDKFIKIEGHADASGRSEYNMQLSMARANAIKQYLHVVHDIDPERMQAVGYGESRPLDQQYPSAAINRRVEFAHWTPEKIK